MEAAVLGQVAMAAAFLAGALLAPEAAVRMAAARSARRAHDAALSGDALAARLLRNGISWANDLARVLSRQPRIAAYFDELCWLASLHGLETRPERVGGVLLAAAMALVLAGGLLGSSPLFGTMSAACLVLGLGMLARQRREQQREAMREEIPSILHAMSSCFHAGYSLLQTFHYSGQEAKGPLRGLFQRAESDLKTGLAASEALRRMREESELSELAFITAALEIQHQTGGSLQQIIDSARDSVEGELALRRSLRVQTAQARLSMRVVTVMPFVLLALFSFSSPDFLSPFFASPTGIAVLALALGMQLAGVLCVRRLLDVGDG